MLYINDPKLIKKAYTYDDAVAQVIKLGVPAQRAYMFLAVNGVRGEKTRTQREDGTYARPIKYAIHDVNTLVTSIKACGNCGSIKLF